MEYPPKSKFPKESSNCSSGSDLSLESPRKQYLQPIVTSTPTSKKDKMEQALSNVEDNKYETGMEDGSYHY